MTHDVGKKTKAGCCKDTRILLIYVYRNIVALDFTPQDCQNWEVLRKPAWLQGWAVIGMHTVIYGMVYKYQKSRMHIDLNKTVPYVQWSHY